MQISQQNRQIQQNIDNSWRNQQSIQDSIRLNRQTQESIRGAMQATDRAREEQYRMQSLRDSQRYTSPGSSYSSPGAQPNDVDLPDLGNARIVPVYRHHLAPPDAFTPPFNAEQRAEARYELAMWLADVGKLEKARDRCQEIVAEHPNTKGAELALAYLKRHSN